LAKLRISSGRLPLLEVVHQAFVGSFTKTLSGLLKRELQVSLQRIETQKASDYFASISQPCCLDIVAAKPLKGSVLFCIDTALLSAMVDGYYGGLGRSVSRDAESTLRPSELRFAQSLLRQIFVDMKQAWTPIAPLEFSLVKHESSTTFIDAVAPTDNVIVNRFLIELPGCAGSIDFAIPESALETVRDKIRGAGSSPNADTGANWRAYFIEHLQDVAIDVRGLLAETRLNLRELKGLKPGDIIPVDSPGNATLCVDRVPVYNGKFGLSRARACRQWQGLSLCGYCYGR
jgi:flagellar motor switch protein FliM